MSAVKGRLRMLLAGLLLCAWAALLPVAAGEGSAPVRTGPLANSPQRVVSLLPSLTETVCALGACGRLVGVDRYSNWPESIEELPRLGGGQDPNIERLMALKPDLVLIGQESRASDRLRTLGIPVQVLRPDTRADMARVTRALAQALGLPCADADALLAKIDEGIAAAAASLPAHRRHQSVYFEVSPAPFAAGSGSFIDDMLQALELDNIMAPELGLFPKINPESVVLADPDYIMTGLTTRAELAQRPGWAGMRALRENQVCVFDAVQRDVLIRPGPRMPQAVQLLADCVSGKLSQ